MENEIHRELDNSEIYDILRTAHSKIKDIIFMDNYEKLSEPQKNVLDAIHSVLYLVEGEFSEF